MTRILSFFVALVLSFCCTTPSFALKPVHDYAIIPDTLGLKYEKNTLTTQDGVHLKSWVFLPADSVNKKVTLLIATADAGNMSWFVTYAAFLCQSGYTVALFDYRGFGQSDPFTTDTSHLYYNEYEQDLSAAVKFYRHKYTGNKFGIWCFSMGSIITTLLPTNEQPDFIIGDSYVVDVQEVRDNIKKLKNKTLVLPSDVRAYPSHITKLKEPVLLFAGTQDMVTLSGAAEAWKSKSPNVSIITYNGGHMQGFRVLSQAFMGSEYIADMNNFIAKLK